MKFIRVLLLGSLATSPLRAEENRYDVVSKLLAPFLGVLAQTTRSPNRALVLSGHVERLTGFSGDLGAATLDLALQAPDRLRLHAPVFDAELTVCRDRQQLWVTPGARVKALLDLATASKQFGKVDPHAQLGPLELPLPEKQLVFLPALLVVKDAGVESVSGEPCRVLDLALMPELQRSLKDQGWTARVCVRADYRPARLVLQRPGWELAVRFDAVIFAPQLPAQTWKPPADDVLTLDAPRFRQIIQAITK